MSAGLSGTLRLALLLAACVGATGTRAEAVPRGDFDEPAAGHDASVPMPVRLVEGQLPSLTSGQAGESQVWRQSVLWQQRGRTQVGLGVAVRTPVLPHGPLATQRGADTTGITGPSGLGQPGLTGAAMALVSVGRPLTQGFSVGVGMGLPVGSPAAPALREALADSASQDARGEVRMGLSFSTRSATSELRRGFALRLDLSGATALTLRPRGGGRVLLQLNSQW